MHYSTRTEEGETAHHEWLCGRCMWTRSPATQRAAKVTAGCSVLLIWMAKSFRGPCPPSFLLAGRSYRFYPVQPGLKIDHSKQREIVSYIASQHPQRRVISTATTGWLGDKLRHPLESVGTGDAIFQSESSSNGEYGKAGTLEGWQKSISAILPGNPLFNWALARHLRARCLYEFTQGAAFTCSGTVPTEKPPS